LEKHISKIREDIEEFKTDLNGRLDAMEIIILTQNDLLHTRMEKIEGVLANNAELSARLDAMEIIALAKGELGMRV